MKNNFEIGNRIRGIREGLQMNRDKFSEMISISEAFLGQIERGERSLSIKTLMSISSNTGFSSDYILFGENSNNTTEKKITKMLNSSNDEFLEFIYGIMYSAKNYSKKVEK